VDASELKAWRKTLGLTQFEAAEKLDVGRTTFQNWEHGSFPVPLSTQLVCESLTRRWKQRPEFGPVTLIYTDRPILPGPECGDETRILLCEFHENNESALTRARLVASGSALHNPAILDLHGEVIWGAPELLRECRKTTVLTTVDDTNTRLVTAPIPRRHAWWELLYGSNGASGRQVKAARALLGWSQAELARAAGVSVAAISQLETTGGNDTIHSKLMSKLRQAAELAGVEFIEKSGGGEGVRLRERTS
jgi:transcriptional regulator with XRE-family HTH domain